MREYSGATPAWSQWIKPSNNGVAWGTTFTCYALKNVAELYVNFNLRVQIYLGGTSDVNVSVLNVLSTGVTSFTKNGTNNTITFGEASASGDDYTITRNGKFITVTRKSNAAMLCIC